MRCGRFLLLSARRLPAVELRLLDDKALLFSCVDESMIRGECARGQYTQKSASVARVRATYFVCHSC